MSQELLVLVLAALLQTLQFAWMSVSANRDIGLAKTTSARDSSRMGGGRLEDQLSDRPARLFRAYGNHFESLVLFTIAVVALELADRTTGASAILAWIYLVARTAYVPAYWFGLRPWRSLIWLVGFVATALMLLLALVP